jgi:hypothetical protein
MASETAEGYHANGPNRVAYSTEAEFAGGLS